MFDYLDYPNAPNPLPETVDYRFVLMYDLERGEDVLPKGAVLYFEPAWKKTTFIPMGMSKLETHVLGVRGKVVILSSELQNTEAHQWLKKHIATTQK